MRYIITGGCGFIGINVINKLIKNKNNKILNIDKLTYSANKKINREFVVKPNYKFLKLDITNKIEIKKAIFSFKPNVIINLAAETHVDKSIDGPRLFVKTNILGVFNLLEISREYFYKIKNTKKKEKQFKFYHISTDEVFGDLKKNEKPFNEKSNFKPNSPYSSSKASGEMLVRAWAKTYGLPVIISNTSNNFGPFQHPEKLIPKIILKIIQGDKIPIYGNGKQIRDWIYVEDHADAIIKIAKKGKLNKTYCIGSNNEMKNIDIIINIYEILRSISNKYKFKLKKLDNLITYVTDRPGHDFRYSIDNSKILKEIDWNPKTSFKQGILKTVIWYIKNYEDLKKISNDRHGLLK